MSAAEQMRAARAESIRLLQTGFAKLTYEQQWDLENEEYFDPAVFREIQQETEQ